MSRIASRSLRGLYAIIDLDSTREPEKLCESVLAGGARVLQLRAKNRDKGGLVGLAATLRARCSQFGAIFVVNDHVDLALAVGADGVHVGQNDLPVPLVRKIAPASFIVGCSTNNVEEARAAEQAGADYIGVGAMFPTRTKVNTRPAGLERLREIRGVTSLPIAAIGGIDASNAALVVGAGADMISVIGALAKSANPVAAARELSELFNSLPAGTGH